MVVVVVVVVVVVGKPVAAASQGSSKNVRERRRERKDGRGQGREREREERLGGPFGPATLTRPHALERERERRERERERLVGLLLGASPLPRDQSGPRGIIRHHPAPSQSNAGLNFALRALHCGGSEKRHGSDGGQRVVKTKFGEFVILFAFQRPGSRPGKMASAGEGPAERTVALTTTEGRTPKICRVCREARGAAQKGFAKSRGQVSGKIRSARFFQREGVLEGCFDSDLSAGRLTVSTLCVSE